MLSVPIRSTTFKRTRTPAIKSFTEAQVARRYVDTGAGDGQVVPMRIETKSGHSAGSFATLSRRSKSKFYYDKWALKDTRTDPVHPRPEVKEFDTNIGTLSVPIRVTSTGAWTSLNDIPRGTDDDSRVGGKIANKAVYYQFVLNLGSVVPAVPTAIRHIVFYDRQSNQADPTVATFFADPTNILTSPMSAAYRNRYIILADDRTTLSPNGDMIRIIKNYYRINLDAQFGDATNEPVSGNVGVFLVSDRLSDTSAPTIYGTWRLRFIDN